MINLPRFSYLLAFLAGSFPLFGESPEVRTEVREEGGKNVTYMYIDGIKVHETDPAKQPFPPVVEPKNYNASKAKAPENAVVLFDGTVSSLSNWSAMNGQATKWKFEDGALIAVPRSGYIRSRQEFGSCKLYLEFSTPVSAKGFRAVQW